MKKYVINEYSITEYKELKLIYELIMRLKELGDIDFFNIQCKETMNLARKWINTENALCFAEYSKDDIVILEFNYKPIDSTFEYAKRDENGIYMEVNE